MLEWIQMMDSAVLLWIQEFLQFTLLNPVMTIYTTLGNAGLLWIGLSGVMLCFPKTRKAGVLALLAMLLGLVCNNGILKQLVARPRPYLTVAELLPLLPPPDPNSFPSGHTCAAFAAAWMWCHTLPRRWMKVLGVVLAVLMGFSRMYVGLHFPTDVLCGALVGLACSQIVWRGYRTLEARGRVHL